MFDFSSLDVITENIKTVVDNNRCVLCDRRDGSRMRFSCGHVSCINCAAFSSECPVCDMPSGSNRPAFDEPLSRQVENVSNLLKLYQDVFKVDVLKRQRYSEQQRIEKELFPNCIQAPIKYYNKRKSVNISFEHSKANPTLFPGEQIGLVNTAMDSSKRYVEQWLLQQEKENIIQPREPFRTLNVNTPLLKQKSGTYAKQSHYKSLSTIEKKGKNKFSKKRKCNTNETHENEVKCVTSGLKCTDSVNLLGCKKPKWEICNYTADLQNESENVPTIVIEDTQSDVLHKDKLAFLAVQEADKRGTTNSAEIKLHCSEIIRYTDLEKTVPSRHSSVIEASYKNQNVPFFKKDIIIEKCLLCKDAKKIHKNNVTYASPNDVTITVESKSFITTVNLTNNMECSSVSKKKQSVPVQTDICGIYCSNVETPTDNNILKTRSDIEAYPINQALASTCNKSKVLFVEDGNSQEEDNTLTKMNHVTNNKITIIQESDSDFEDEQRSPSYNSELTFGVLTELDRDILKYRTRSRNRHPTPTSTDSSDKENRDPNKIKLPKLGKKKIKKK